MSARAPMLAALVACALGAGGALAGPAPARHPYLFFTRQELPALRQRIGHPEIAPLWETVRRKALRPDRGPRQANNILCAGIAYNLTGERAYAEPAIDILMRIAHDGRSWTASGSGLKYCDLGTAIKTLPLAYGYDMLYDAMTPDQREACLRALRTKVFPNYLEALAIHDTERRRFTDRQGHAEWWSNCYFNWNPWVNGDIGLAALATLNELPESARVLQRARESLRYMHPEFDQGQAEDGGWDEGPMYWSGTLAHSVHFYAALERVLGTDDGFFELPGVRKTMQYGMDFTAPDGKWVNFQDCPDRLVLDPPGELYFLAARYGEPQYMRHVDVNSASWHELPFGVLWRPLAETPPAEPRPRARWYRDVQWAALATDGLFLPFKAGDLGANHGQNDANNLLLWVNGERMLNDPGYGARDTADHNCLLVDGRGQTRGRGRRHFGGHTTAFATILDCRAVGEDAYLVSEAASCYGGALERCQRHVIASDAGHVIVFDDVEASAPAQFTVNWHTLHNAQLTGPAAGAIAGSRERLHLAWAAETPLSVELTPTRFDRAFKAHSPGGRRAWRLFTVLASGAAPAVQARFTEGAATIVVNGRAHAFERAPEGGYRYAAARAAPAPAR